jgi:acyl-CoA synthetase (AMP-forming)/AMP-acid ligase II
LEFKEIQQVAVLPIPHNKWGNLPAAFIVLEDTFKEISEHAFKENVKKKLLTSLPPYKIPEHMIIINKLPVNLGGKLDKLKLSTLII